jgi:multiple sugar transport system permease protein
MWWIHRWGVSRDDLLGYALIFPSILILFLVLTVPLVVSLFNSFQRVNLVRPELNEFVGIANYARLVQDPLVWRSFRITFSFALVAVVVELVLGFAIALLLNLRFPGRGAVRTGLILPMMLSEVVAALSWLLILDADFGVGNFLLSLLKISPQLWLGPEKALLSVVIVEVWQHTPFVVLVLLAGLQAIPDDLLEAARVDGASMWGELRHITVPLLRPSILVALTFRTIFVLRVFVPVWILTQGGPADRTMVVGIQIYRTAFRYSELGAASALSWLLLLITLLLACVYLRFLSREALA